MELSNPLHASQSQGTILKRITNYKQLIPIDKHKKCIAEVARSLNASLCIPQPVIQQATTKQISTISRASASKQLIINMKDAMRVSGSFNFKLSNIKRPKEAANQSFSINKERSYSTLHKRREDQIFLLDFCAKQNLVSKIISSTFIKIQRDTDILKTKELINKRRECSHNSPTSYALVQSTIHHKKHKPLQNENTSFLDEPKAQGSDAQDIPLHDTFSTLAKGKHSDDVEQKKRPRVALYTHVLNPYMLPPHSTYESVSASTIGILKAMQTSHSKLKRGFKLK